MKKLTLLPEDWGDEGLVEDELGEMMMTMGQPLLQRVLEDDSLLYSSDDDQHEHRSQADPNQPLLDAKRVNKIFPTAANVALVLYLMLLILIYSVTPRSEWTYVSKYERHGAIVAFLILLVSNMIITSRFFFQQRWKHHMDGIVYASMVCQAISMSTNLLLGFAPTVVKVDTVTHSRVFMIRWVEFVPLAGLMTFISEGVDIPSAPGGLRKAILAALVQSFSCLCALIFPYCPSIVSWIFWLSLSTLAYSSIFPRTLAKRQRYLEACREMDKSGCAMDREGLDRIRFAYVLSLVCSVIWTAFVLMYFANTAAHLLLPEDHYLRQFSLAMLVDTVIDVTAKGIYLKLVVDVHFAVFDTDGQAKRQLSELRSLMSVLWDSSSDAIIISARHGDRVTSLLSPSFLKLVDVTLPEEVSSRKSVALLLETGTREDVEDDGDDEDEEDESDSGVTNEAEGEVCCEELHDVLSCSYVDCTEIPYAGLSDESHVAEVDDAILHKVNASGLIVAAWKHVGLSQSESVLSYQFHEQQFEIKVSPHSESTLVAVVRDVTERHRRMEAERKAHLETVARQKDAQSQTRFVRHEVKNGLLAGIELCDSLSNSIEDVERMIAMLKCNSSRNSLADASIGSFKDGSEVATDDGTNSTRSRRLMEDLDVALHDVLDTVLAEAMARDVIHEVYQPRSERLDVLGLLTNSRSRAPDGIAKADRLRFPVISTKPDIPYLVLDPQLLRYIHQNAISNACKYGKQGGTVLTELRYDIQTRLFQMKVINAPGEGHDHLVALGSNASSTVFSRGSMLHKDATHQTSYVSSGDGAWNMQKCARTMRGRCDINFAEHQTVFTFSCVAEPLCVMDLPETHEFKVPEDTWGIAVDDSKIQRKLMVRILGHIGIEVAQRMVLGADPEEVFDVGRVIMDILAKHPTSKVLVVVDENLDFGGDADQGGDPVILSGSVVMQGVLAKMPPKQEARVLVLIRSANDSADDVALYASRTHGFFPKAPMQKDRVRELIAPLWAERFLKHRAVVTPSSSQPVASSLSSTTTATSGSCIISGCTDGSTTSSTASTMMSAKRDRSIAARSVRFI